MVAFVVGQPPIGGKELVAARESQFVCSHKQLHEQRLGHASAGPRRSDARGLTSMAASRRTSSKSNSSSSRRSGGGGGSTRGSGMKGVDTSMDRRRPNRVAEMIKREISVVLKDQYLMHGRLHGLPTWSTLMLSVMDVNVSPDLRNARVEVSMAQTDSQKVVKWLNGNRRTLRYEMAQRMTHMKVMPDLYFRESGAGGAFRTVALLDELSKKRVSAPTNFDELEADSDAEGESDGEFDLDAGGEFDLDKAIPEKRE